MKFKDVKPGMIIASKSSTSTPFFVAKKESGQVAIVSTDGVGYLTVRSKEWDKDSFEWSSLEELSSQTEKRNLIAKCFENKSVLDKIVAAIWGPQ